MSLDEAPTVRVNSLPPRPTPNVEPQEGERVLLYYCARCTKMILPPGSEGIHAEGKRCCATCAPFETDNPPATAMYTTSASGSGRVDFVRGSSARLKVADGVEVPAPRVPSGRSAPVLSARTAARPPSRKLKWAGVAALAALALLVAGIFIKGGALQSLKPSTAVVAPKQPPKLEPFTPPAPPPRQLSEQEKRQQVLSHGTGLFGNLKPDEVATAPALPALPGPRPAEVKPEVVEPTLKIEGLDAAVEALQPLLEKERFSEAGDVLEDLKKKFSQVPGWETKKELIAQSRELLQRRYASYEQAAADATAQAQTASTLAAVDELEKSWTPRMALGEMSAKQARRVLDAAHQSRTRLSADSDKRLASLGEKLQEIETHSKGKLSKADMELWLKALHEFKMQLHNDPATAERIAERYAALNVNLRLARGPEKLFYNLEPCAGDHCDLKYDFANADQAAPWKFDGDTGAGNGFQLDPKKKTVTLTLTGASRPRTVFEEPSDQRAANVQLPFLFSTPNWSVEAEVAITKAREREKKEQNPVYGIFISDGGANVLRFNAQELSKGVLQLSARAPGAENEKDKQARMQGKQSDKLRLRMECRNGVVGFGATASAHPASSGRAKLTFEPKLVGVFVETRDPEENAALTISSFKFSGAWDNEKLKTAIEARRAAESAALKTELHK